MYFSQVDCIEMSLYDGSSVPSPSNRKAFINQPCGLIAEFIEKHKDYENGDKGYSCIFLVISIDNVKLYT